MPRGRYALATNTLFLIGWGTFFFSILLILFGYSAELFALPISGTALASLGVLTLASSLTVTFQAMAKGFVTLRRYRNGYRNPERHWLADHIWSEKSLSDTSPVQARDALLRGLLVGAFALPVAYIALAASTPALARLCALGLGLTLTAVSANQIWVAQKFRRSIQEHGVARLEFARFPFFLNDEVDVTFFTGIPGRLESPLQVTLRCLSEKRVLVKRRGRPAWETQVWEIYRDSQQFPQTTQLGDGLRLQFFVPGECKPTALRRLPPCYWQLSLQARRKGLDLDTEFLVPVYSPLPEEET